ncbi:MAG: hypothetical protein HHJ13_17885 [Phycicoccus sp.]|nr:hypothetical protein [Phycicoccus sp.]
MRVMLRAQFMGVVRLAIWTGAFLLGVAGTMVRRLDLSRWASRLAHPSTIFGAHSRQARANAEASPAVDVAHDNGMRLIEQCEAGSAASEVASEVASRKAPSRSNTNVLAANLRQ